MFRVEPGEVVAAGECSCCGREQRSTYGFVHEGDETIAFYYALLEPPHRKRRRATLTVSLGDWTREADPSTRSAATLRAQSAAGEIEVAFVDASESPYRDRAVLGQMSGRKDVVESVLRDRFCDVARAILLEDPEVNEHLARE